MVLVADQKRRVVLPKPAQPGDAFECVESGGRFILVRLARVVPEKPPVAPIPLAPGVLQGIDLDAPAFAPIDDARVA